MLSWEAGNLPWPITATSGNPFMASHENSSFPMPYFLCQPNAIGQARKLCRQRWRPAKQLPPPPPPTQTSTPFSLPVFIPASLAAHSSCRDLYQLISLRSHALPDKKTEATKTNQPPNSHSHHLAYSHGALFLSILLCTKQTQITVTQQVASEKSQ